MTTAAPAGTELLGLIRGKRTEVQNFLTKAGPSRRRLVNVNIGAGGLSALLTAGPALGGKTFAAWLTAIFGLTAPAWQLLCGAAALSSLVATVATQWMKSHQIDERFFKAQGLAARLEALELGVVSGTYDTARATAEYTQCIEGAAFLKE